MIHARSSAKIAGIAESATLRVDAKAKALQATGRPVISFAAGEPNFPTPEHIVAAAVAAAQDPKNHRYTPSAGLPELRAAIAERVARESGWQVTSDQVIVTNGGKQAVYQAFQALLDPGDEVLVPTPYWTTYPEVIALAGGRHVSVLADAASGYRVTVAQLEAARTERTKVLLFASPANPTGAVYSPAEVRAIAEWADEHELWVISDEIYRNLTYSDDPTVAPPAMSPITAVPSLADRFVLLSGVAKTYAMTGWRVGWLVAPADITRGVINLQSHLTSNVANVSQRAALAALTGPQDAVETMRRAFDVRRRAIVAGLSAIPGFRVPVPDGAFYVYADVQALLGVERYGVTPHTSVELAELILERAEVAAVPGEAFGPSGHLRFSYALADATLEEGVARLAAFVREPS